MTNSPTAAAGAAKRSHLFTLARLRSWLVAEFPLLLLVLATASLRMVLHDDVSLADEAGYVKTGIGMIHGLHPAWSDFPGYCALYTLGYAATGSATAAYFIGRAIGSAALIGAVWYGTRSFTSRRTAFVVSFLVAALGAPYVWPGVGMFAAALLAVGSVLLVRRPDVRGCAAASVFFWWAATVRLEYWPAAAACSLCTGWYLFQEMRRRRVAPSVAPSAREPSMLWPALSFAVPAALFALRLPIGEGRLWNAFGAHYALANPIRGQSPWTGWQAVLVRDFGSSTSIPGALMAAPVKFLSFVGGNVLRTPLYFGALLLERHGPYLGGLAVSVIAAVLLIAPLGKLAADRISRRRSVAKTGTARPTAIIAAYLPIGVLAVINVGILTVIYPRYHYLILWVPGLAIVAGVGMERALAPSASKVLSQFAVVLVLAPLVASTVFYAAQVPRKPLAETVYEMARLPGHHVLLSGDWGLSAYDSDVTEIDSGPLPGGVLTFSQFLREKNADLVLVGYYLDGGPWSALPGYAAFVSDPAKFGYTRISVGSPLWVRSDRL